MTEQMIRARLERAFPRIANTLRAYREGRDHELETLDRVWAVPMQMILLIWREAARDNTFRTAGSLAFVSVLSIIPLLSVVTALLAAYGMFEPGNDDLVHYFEMLFPTSGLQIAVYLGEFSGKGASSIGGLNGLSLLVISILMFNSIEGALTDIWRGAHDRPPLTKILMFYTLITLGPLLLAVSIIQSASAQIFIASRTGLDTGFMDNVWPALTAMGVFTLMNKFLPNVRVLWSSAILAGVVTAAAFELAKWGFNQYVNLLLLDSYNRLYGTLALAPIFMAWVFVTWSVVLLGAELAYCHQHFRQLLRTDAALYRMFQGNHSEHQVLDPLVPLELCAPIFTKWAAGNGSMRESNLRYETGRSPELVRTVVDSLVSARVLLVHGQGKGNARKLIPARQLEEIALLDIMEAVKSPGALKTYEQLDLVREAHEAAIQEILADKTAHDLVDIEAHEQLVEELGLVEMKGAEALGE